MGSLMAGWNSPVLGEDTKARRIRTRSLTKEEVEAFWRQQGKPVPEGVSGGEIVVDITSPLASPPQTMEKSPLSKERSVSPMARGHDEVDTGDADADGAGESPCKSKDWWTRSNWAFLNEPPQEEAPGTAHSYTPQFDVAAGRVATGNA